MTPWQSDSIAISHTSIQVVLNSSFYDKVFRLKDLRDFSHCFGIFDSGLKSFRSRAKVRPTFSRIPRYVNLYVFMFFQNICSFQITPVTKSRCNTFSKLIEVTCFVQGIANERAN